MKILSGERFILLLCITSVTVAAIFIYYEMNPSVSELDKSELQSLENPTLDQITELLKRDTGSGTYSNIKELNFSTAKAFVANNQVDWLEFPNLKSISYEPAKVLSDWLKQKPHGQSKVLRIHNVSDIDARTFKTLIPPQRRPNNPGSAFRKQPEDQIAWLIDVDLRGLTSIDWETAEAIVNTQKNFNLANVKSIDWRTLEILMNIEGSLSLGISQIDEATAKVLSDFRGNYLNLSECESIALDAMPILKKLARRLTTDFYSGVEEEKQTARLILPKKYQGRE